MRLVEYSAVADCIGEAFSFRSSALDPAGFGNGPDSPVSPPGQIPGGNTDPTLHPGVRIRLEKADQVEIGHGKSGFEHKSAIPPTSIDAHRSGQVACDTL